MSGGIGLTVQSVSRVQRSHTAQGIIAESGPYIFHATATAPTSQSVYGVLVGLNVGDLVTGIMIRNGVAAAGTSPTTARFGIANSSGTMLAVSGDVKTAAEWGLGPIGFALSSPYTITSSGGYYLCFVVNGTWGTTQPTPLRVGANAAGGTAFGSAAPPCFIWTGQTDLPAVASPLTISTSGGVTYYMAAY